MKMLMKNAPKFVFVAGDVEVNAILKKVQFDSISEHDGWTYYGNSKFWMIHTGIGAMNAACCAYSFVKTFTPMLCLQIGFSGAHQADLEMGDIVLGKEVRDFSRHTKNPQPKWQ